MGELDYAALDRELDRTKRDLFMTRYAGFYGPLLCSLEFHWTTRVKTAATNGVDLFWNPHFFLELSSEARKTVLRHELDHPALFHFDRMGSRDPTIWNYATDIRINNGLDLEHDEKGRKSYSFEGLEWCWKDHSYAPGTPEEDIYDDLIAKGIKPPPEGAWGFGDGGDLSHERLDGPMTKDDFCKAINNIVRAAEQAKLSGPGNMPQDIEDRINTFLAPVVHWEAEVCQFFTELADEEYTLSKPNRRHTDIYLPSRFVDDGALAHLAYYTDVSGSILRADFIRFMSEIKYNKDTFQPEKMTHIQFDVRIVCEKEYTREDPLDYVIREGCGGTHLECVRQHIIETKPTAAIIFSDLECKPMRPIGLDIPVLWVCINNRGKNVPFGRLIHIR